MTEFRVECKMGKREASIPFIIPDECIAEINAKVERGEEFMKTDSGTFLLDKIEGDYELDLDNAVISQIGWLLKYREVAYFSVDEKRKKFILGVKFRED